ncbi:MAG: hypothetical protein II916_09440 [Oscillospiraceae bacterium]|nr:hypothetical protein [Oscillospiraceae bacterium]
MAEEHSTEQRKKRKGRISWKAIGIALLAVLVLVGAGYGVIRFTQWRNDGSAYAERLSEQIGVSAETAQKYAHINLESASQFACINMAAEDYPHLFESTRKTEVLGVTVPQWVIYIGEDGDKMTQVLYYDYRQLQKFGTGVKTDAKIGTEGITAGMTPEAVQQYVGFAPLKTAYTASDMTEDYKYYFKDQNTGNTVSYVITVTYADGQVKTVTEEENYFILSVLTME